MKIIAVHTFN